MKRKKNQLYNLQLQEIFSITMKYRFQIWEFIDASSNHLVMSDGGLVSLVNCVSNDTTEQQENVVNIVTSTATNEQGQQIVIIENLDQHSPELQREIMNALLADHTIVPISQ